MIDEARVLARKLRSAYGYSPATNRAAAQCLEKLAALVESEKRKSGLLSMLTSAESAAETYKRERDAAVSDLKEADRLECKHCRWFGLCQTSDGEDIDCETCTLECKCRDCRDNDQWEWRGVKKDLEEGDHA